MVADTEAAVDPRCPVLVLTGALGSGKTTLMQHWLKQEVLQHCAVIVNEIGEVPFDATQLGLDVAAAGVMAQQCVCCTGLPDLQDTLEQFFWDRLHRTMRRFDRVVIETSGVASPQPLTGLLSGHPFLREKYRLEAVVTAVSAVADWPAPANTVAHEQIRHAGALVITKRDRIDPLQEGALRTRIDAHAPAAAVAISGRGGMPGLADLLDAVSTRILAPAPAGLSPHAQALELWRSRSIQTRPACPDVRTWFEPLSQPLELEEMRARASNWVAQAQALGVIRLKGLWRCKAPIEGDHPWEVQWTLGDAYPQIGPADLHGNYQRESPRTHNRSSIPWGITFIAMAARSS